MRRFARCPTVRLGLPEGDVLAWVAQDFGVRLAGLAVLASLPDDRALLIPHCRSVHTFGMRFAIDVLFVSWPPADGDVTVLGLHVGVPPRRLVSARGGNGGNGGAGGNGGRGAALELPAGQARQLGILRGSTLALAL